MNAHRRWTTTDSTDEELVVAANDGDQAALGLLLERHYDRIRAVCVRIAGSTRDGDDATQDAMIRIVKNLHGFDGRSRFGTWAYRIATNAAIDELRRRQRRGQLSVVGEETAPERADPLSTLPIESLDSHLELSAVLRDMPETFRTPVVLRDVADLDYEQIAEVLDVPIGTVRSRIARGRQMLRERLGNQIEPSERPTEQSQHADRPTRPSTPETTPETTPD